MNEKMGTIELKNVETQGAFGKIIYHLEKTENKNLGNQNKQSTDKDNTKIENTTIQQDRNNTRT